MPVKKTAPSDGTKAFISPFQTADKLLREDRGKTENQKRFERWVDIMVRERKLDPSWNEDRESALRADWVAGRVRMLPGADKKNNVKVGERSDRD